MCLCKSRVKLNIMHLSPNYPLESKHEFTEKIPFCSSSSIAFTLDGVRPHTLCLQDMSSLNPGCRTAGIPVPALPLEMGIMLLRFFLE